MVFATVLLVFTGFAVAVTLRPALIVAMAVMVYAFEQWTQANSSFFAGHAQAINIGFGLLALYALACALFRHKKPLAPITPLMWTCVVLLAYTAVSTLWSINRSLSMSVFLYQLPYVVTAVIIPLTVHDRDDLRQALTLTFVFGTLVTMLMLLHTRVDKWGRSVAVAEQSVVTDRTGKMITRLDPLSVASAGGQLFVVAVLLNVRGPVRAGPILRWAGVLLAMGLIYRSGSRGQLFAGLFTVLVLIVFSRGTKSAIGWIAAGASTLFVLLIALWSFSGFATNVARWDLDFMAEEYSSTRLYYCARLIDFWVHGSPLNWLFGLGTAASYDSRINQIHCHVTFVEVLAELGFVGMAIYATFVALTLHEIIRLYSLTRTSKADRGVTVALAGLFFFTLLVSFKQGSMLSNNAVLMWAVILSRQHAIMRSAHRRQKALALRQRWSAWAPQAHRVDVLRSLRPQ